MYASSLPTAQDEPVTIKNLDILKEAAEIGEGAALCQSDLGDSPW